MVRGCPDNSHPWLVWQLIFMTCLPNWLLSEGSSTVSFTLLSPKLNVTCSHRFGSNSVRVHQWWLDGPTKAFYKRRLSNLAKGPLLQFHINHSRHFFCFIMQTDAVTAALSFLAMIGLSVRSWLELIAASSSWQLDTKNPVAPWLVQTATPEYL